MVPLRVGVLSQVGSQPSVPSAHPRILPAARAGSGWEDGTGNGVTGPGPHCCFHLTLGQ